MTAMKKLLLAFTVLGATAMAHADDNFASLTLGQTSDKVKKSDALNSALNNPNADGIIGKDTTYGLRLGKQNDRAATTPPTTMSRAPTTASSCARKTCWAATMCSIRSPAAPNCLAAARRA